MENMSGRIWKFGDDIDTNLIRGGGSEHHGVVTEEVLKEYCMKAIRPGWSAQVEPGDILVVGSNFGCGSARPAAEVLVSMGIRIVVAKSFSRIFFRNGINAGMLLIENGEIQEKCEEGEVLEVHPEERFICIQGKEERYSIPKLPENMLRIIESGGLLNYLRSLNGLPPLGGK